MLARKMYTIGPGQDMNRFDLDIPLRNGYILAVSPSLRKADDLTEYVHTLIPSKRATAGQALKEDAAQ